MSQDDLSILDVVPSDRKKLESMGFTTLEQLAMLHEYRLGLGKAKSKSIIQRARNILLNRHLKEIEIRKDLVIAIFDREVTDPLELSIIDTLNAYVGEYGNSRVQVSGNKVRVLNSYNYDSLSFNIVIENARMLQTIIQAKTRNKLGRKGITLQQEEIVRFARERGFKGFYENAFSEIVGSETLKSALAIALFSTFEEPNHVLIIGDPASGKSFAKEIILRNFKDVSNVGGMSTRAGLVMSMSTGQLGVLAHSDQRIVLVDEFDKIPEQDVQYIYELLAEGKCSVHSAKIHADIESHFIMIALANPKSGAFRGDPMQEINLPLPLVSRFSIVVKAPILSEEERERVIREKITSLSSISEIQKLPEQYNQWVKLARLHKPQFEVSRKKLNDYVNEANNLITRLYSSPLRRDLRVADYAKRILGSVARAEFGNVTDETIDIALGVINRSIDEWYSR